MAGLWDLSAFERKGDYRLAGQTIPALFWAGVAARGERIFLREKKLGIWQGWSWQAVGEAVREMALGLDSLDLPPRAVAAILANTRLEWLLADLAIQSAGCVANGIYPTDAPSQVQYLCADSAAELIFVEDDEQLDKVLEVRGQLPALRWIVVFDPQGLEGFHDPMVLSLEALRARGRAHAQPQRFDERLAAVQPEDLAILVYTSGTTGKPKGAMHVHAGLVSAVRSACANLPQFDSDERVCFLPLCHIAERLIGAYSALLSGATLNFVESPDTFAENLREVSPHVLFAVPRVWEKFYSAISIAVAEASPLQQRAYRWAIATGQAVVQRVLGRQPVPLGLKLRFRLADWLVLGNVRRTIGIERARVLVSGAAPISPDLIRWYLALGLPMLEGWGMTETCAHGTLTLPEDIRPGTIGPPAPGVEMRIDPYTGEMLTRGPHLFRGYLNQPEKTAEVIDAEGWFHTGDVGRLDEQGHYRITDRMKDIIITAGGKNITPSEIENQLKFSPYITDAVVIGDRRAYLTALIMIDQDNVERFAQEHDVPFSNYASLTRAPQVLALIQAEVERVNQEFARVEQVKAFRLLETQLSAEDEELTPTMKLKRSFVQKKYADLIESMYRAA
ncbi:long-chain fatty acid--CoA ligase [Inhella sp.]|uniref:AMP-dependent synthetase/ligase n=1 Tax=Inhella sp. TaxID=1921806 RepID=UPI0035B06FD6